MANGAGGLRPAAQDLVNSLQTGFPLPKDRLAAIVSACGLPENVRGERLSLADYAALADALARETELLGVL